MSENSELSEALKIVEKIPQRPFAQLLRRLAIALKERDNIPFSEDEVQILLEQFKLTPTELESFFSACQYVLQQAACYSFNSEKTQMYASQCGVPDEIAECFSAVWDAEGEDLINALKSRTLTDDVLNSTSWRLNLKAAENGKAPTKQPIMLLDLNVSGKKPITIQFNHEELSKFYDQIEQIQQQVDHLT